MSTKRNNVHAKLHLYSQVKDDFTYEEYLNIRGINSLIRFRLSAHWLPIERGRHKRPIINREDRLCPLCKTCVGDEIHALMECKSDELKNIRSAYLPKIKTLLPDLESMTETQQFYCLMKCANMLIVPLVAKWVDLCNNKFKI